MFTAKRAQPDIQVAVAYLYTRDREPTKDDYLKLARVILYMDESGTLLWSIDASFAVHNDMRSHKEAVLIFGRGIVFSLSNKQKG